MKLALLTSLFTLLSIFLQAQQYDNLHVEKSGVDKNNEIYVTGREFVFSYEIHKDDQKYLLNKNDSKGFELSKNADSSKIKEIHLTIAKPNPFQRTNKNQTEVYISYEPAPMRVYSTGLVENDQNVWMHPPRTGYFGGLETCPFPYIQLNKPMGHKWDESMSIGNHWSDPEWGEWEGRLLLQYNYEIVSVEKLQTPLGEIACWIIDATAASEIGESSLRAYFSEEYGFVKLNYTLASGIKINLHLNEIIEGPTVRDARDFFESRR